MDWDLGRWYCRWSKLASRCWVQSMWSSYWECIYQSANDQITRDCENSARWMLTWSRKDSGKIHRVKGSLEYRYNQSIRPYHQKQRSRKATLTNPVADLWVFFFWFKAEIDIRVGSVGFQKRHRGLELTPQIRKNRIWEIFQPFTDWLLSLAWRARSTEISTKLPHQT